ncbi:YjbH domain-containing protein [Rheinheimera sp. MMS21-TC3]|uniref:YjbH domain-containing protein n=1 Tax=Rheinheimera sp. MMS21-TC3 TaxID=3072790 RepID=UPI0028C3E3CA|nr:YjbH domain-containing protein [Rheinheimera sp. MMS21-TC3]WNO62255.1 YjbH domain-containing protein [Rheinheimera sp. MMS21-TC3]
MEYEGNDYSRDRAGELTQDSRWNLGAVYKWNNFSFDLNYQRGNTLGFGVHYALNLHQAKQVKIKPAMQPIPQVLAEKVSITDKDIIPRMLLTEAGFLLQTSRVTDDEFIIYGQQLSYRDDAEATERIGRILVNEIPSYIKRIRVVEYAGNLAMVEKVIEVEPFIAAARYDVLEPNVLSTYVRQNQMKPYWQWQISLIQLVFIPAWKPFGSRPLATLKHFICIKEGCF